MKIVGVHGIRVSDGGQKSLSSVLDCLEKKGYEVDLLNYGRVGLLTNRFRLNSAVESLQKLEPDVTIGHSHGNVVVYHACRDGMKLNTHIAYQPAMRRDTVWPNSIDKIVTLYNKRDWSVRFGRAWTWVNPVSWFHPHDWGSAGAHGFLGEDERMTQINVVKYNKKGHSYMKNNPKFWCEFLSNHFGSDS